MSRRLSVAALAGMLLTLLVVAPGATPAFAAECGQPTHVWVGGLDNNGAISSDSPGGTIYVQVGHGVYLTGVVEISTSIRFDVVHSTGAPNDSRPTTASDLNCVVHHDQNFVYDVFTTPETQAWFATYEEWETHDTVTHFLGYIVVY